MNGLEQRRNKHGTHHGTSGLHPSATATTESTTTTEEDAIPLHELAGIKAGRGAGRFDVFGLIRESISAFAGTGVGDEACFVGASILDPVAIALCLFFFSIPQSW